jgi:hypothetical protein
MSAAERVRGIGTSALSRSGDPPDLSSIERRYDAVLDVETVAFGHNELHYRRHTSVPLGSDALHAIASLEGDTEGHQAGAVVGAHPRIMLPGLGRQGQPPGGLRSGFAQMRGAVRTRAPWRVT